MIMELNFSFKLSLKFILIENSLPLLFNSRDDNSPFNFDFVAFFTTFFCVWT